MCSLTSPGNPAESMCDCIDLIVKLDVETWAALSSWMVVPTCLIVKPHPECMVVGALAISVGYAIL